VRAVKHSPAMLCFRAERAEDESVRGQRRTLAGHIGQDRNGPSPELAGMMTAGGRAARAPYRDAAKGLTRSRPLGTESGHLARQQATIQRRYRQHTAVGSSCFVLRHCAWQGMEGTAWGGHRRPCRDLLPWGRLPLTTLRAGLVEDSVAAFLAAHLVALAQLVGLAAACRKRDNGHAAHVDSPPCERPPAPS
jgi:hypothetical protein